MVVSDYFKIKRESVEIVDLKKLIPSVWGESTTAPSPSPESPIAPFSK